MLFFVCTRLLFIDIVAPSPTIIPAVADALARNDPLSLCTTGTKQQKRWAAKEEIRYEVRADDCIERHKKREVEPKATPNILR